MAQLVLETERAWQALGSVTYGPTEEERESTQFRRSLYVTENMRAGEALSEHNMRAVRPGRGLPTKYLEALIGRRVNCDVSRGTPVSWDILS
jgi:N-acetylneuraminate synthase